MDISHKTKKYFRSAFSAALGSGTVFAGAYLFSRIEEKQDTQTRLERIEQMLDKLSEEEKEK